MAEDKTGFSELKDRYDDKNFEMHPFTLCFASGEKEVQFRKHYFSNSISAFRLSFVTVIFLIAAFGYFDSMVTDRYLSEFYIARFLIVVPVLVIVFIFSYSRFFIRIWQELLVISYVTGGLAFIFMVLIEPEARIYYAGLLLVFMAGYFFIKLRFIPALIGGIILLTVYAVGSGFILPRMVGLDYFYITNAFLVSGNLIAMLALHHLEYLERKGFQHNFQLKEQKKEIDNINSDLENQVVKRTNLLDIRNKSLLKEINIRRVIEKELVVAKEKAEESDRLKTAFLANMSHEIRTPMNGILGFANLLKKPGLIGEKQQAFIEIIEKSGKRMLNIINDIIDISKIEAGLMKLDIKESNLNEHIGYIYTFFKPEAESKGMNLSFKNPLPAKESIISTDSEKLNAILANLVKNSIKYTEEGSIELGYNLKTDTKPEELEFYVKDTGIGIPKDRQEAIFDRFIQADIANEKAHQGAGLGLSITKAYVEMLGGKIWVESEEGKGSTFYFTLPYNTQPAAKTTDRQLEPSGKHNDVRKLKILVAEDDEVSEMLLDETVKMFAKEILKAGTGVEAVKACRENPDIDLIMMDIRMPEMGGYEATLQIREFNKEVIIIAQTAYGQTGDREKSIESGCNDYIAKPINENELQEMVQKYFGK